MSFIARIGPAATEFIGVSLAEFKAPLPDTFITNLNPPPGQHQIDFSETESKVEIEPNSFFNNFDWVTMTFVRRGCLYFLGVDRFGFQVITLLSVVRKLIERFLGIISHLAFPRFLNLTIPFVRVDYLTDQIYTRDMWMHRLDICRAVGLEMDLTPNHDGRLTALVMRDLARRKGDKLDGESVTYSLSGPAGGVWYIGKVGSPTARLEMDALDFHRLAAGRITPDSLIQQNLVVINGDYGTGELALRRTSVPY